MKKRVVITLLFLVFLSSINFIFAETISEDLHLNIQTTYSNGTIQTGTFDFEFNISTTSDCANVVYSNSTTLTTDSRGIISYYIPDVSLNYSIQYYLCYYRDNSLINASKIVRTPYTFRAQNISASGIDNDSNLNLDNYNITASYFCNSTNCYTIDNFIDSSTGDITAVTTSGKYLTGGQTTGDVNLLVNETELNTTIDSRITINNNSIINWVTSTFAQIANILDLVGNWSADKSDYYNTTQVNEINTSMKNYVDDLNAQNISDTLDGYDSTFFMPLNNSVFGQFDFNNGWLSDGLSIIGGNIYAQMGYFYNISSLVVSNLNINGSLYPVEGFDNQFDIGSLVLRWRDINIGGELHSNGTGDNYFLGNLGIGTGTPQRELHVTGDILANGTINSTTDICIEGGNCLSSGIGSESDPYWNANYTNLQTDCGIGYYSYGIYENGTLKCREDSGVGAESDPYWTGNSTNVAYTNIYEEFDENLSVAKNFSVDENTLYVDSDNNKIGIGTSSPLSKFHLKEGENSDSISSGYSGDPAARIINTGGSAGNDGLLVAVGRDASDTALFLAGFKNVATGAFTPYFYIDGTGKIGIGTGTPQNELNVVGDANITGTLYIDETNITERIEVNNDSMKNYVDGTFVELAGDSMQGNLNITSYNITTTGSGTIYSNSTCIKIQGATSTLEIC